MHPTGSSKPDLDVINVKTKGSDRVSEFTLRVSQKAKQEKDEAAP